MRKLTAVALATGCAAGLAACGSSGATPASSGKSSQSVTFATDFGLYGRQSLFFTALKRGYYKAAGLDVSIQAGNGSASTVEEVAADKAQIGFADIGTFITALGKTSIPVTLVSAIYQRTAITLFGIRTASLSTPSDIPGKTAACAAGDATQTLWPAYAKAIHVNPGSLSFIHTAPSSFPTLLSSGRVQLVCEFSVGEPLLKLAVHGRPLVAFEYGAKLSLYGNGIIVNTHFLDAHKSAVTAFVKASLEGATYAFGHPTQAGQYTKAINPVYQPK
jgi:NitT/TauT family transport system substrate-binding protein